METILTDICEELHNWFTPHDGVHSGTFTIENGSIDLPLLKTRQYFRIKGSALNDGVYRYPVYDLEDEEFTGSIWAMEVPLIVVGIAAEIGEYRAKSEAGGGSMAPYTSESFGGYSYSIATNSDGAPITWREAFKSRLNRWRKLP